MLSGKNTGDKVCSNVWTTCNGVAGRRFFGMTSGYEDKSIFLPAAGHDLANGKGRDLAGDLGDYWSSSESTIDQAMRLVFNVFNVSVDKDRRKSGMSVRAVRDTPKPISLGEVKSHEPWDGKFDVEYTLKGLEADVEYKVAFDVKAAGQTASVTNAAAKLANGTYTNTLNTVDLFGAKTMNKKAEITARLIKVESAESLGGVQLWENGPIWAEANVGATNPEDYGILTNFDNAAKAVTDALGEGWRLPSKEEFDKLVSDEYCTSAWDDTKKGYTFTGKTDGYTGKSIFFPAAGIDYGRGSGRQDAGEKGYCWSSTEEDATYAFYLNLPKSMKPFEYSTGRKFGLSVRAVRDATTEIGKDGPKTFCLGPAVYGQDLRRLKPYLYEIWYDYYEDSGLTGDDAPFGDLPVPGLGGCSSVRVGDFHGRNLDLGISDTASIVVHVKADEGRFASVGTTQWGDVSETALTTHGVSVHRFDVLPSWMLDGINEKGVAININVVPTDVPQDGDDPGSDTRPALHARKVVRYVLDHAESAAGVIEDLKQFRIHGNIGTGTYYLHWMISDAEKTFVVEIINGEVVAREHPIMTNFYLNWDNKNERAILPSEFENWGPDKYFNPAIYSNDPAKILEVYTPHGDGIERYLTLRDALSPECGTFEGMFNLMRSARYSRVADLPLDQTFRSDLAEISEVKNAGLDDIAKVYAASNATKLAEVWAELQPKMADVYANLADHRKPGEMGEYSITSHNVTFDLKKKMFRIVVQEEYNEPLDFYLAQPKVEVIGTPSVDPNPGGDPTAGIDFKVTSDVGGTNLVFEVAVYSKDRVPYFTDGDISADNGASFKQDVQKWYGTAGTTQSVHLVWLWKRYYPDLVDWNDVTVEVTAKVQGSDVAVKCKNGTFVGVRDSASGVVAFKSVPYAKPPTKETGLRWKPPVRPDDSEAVVSARHFGPAAAQTRTSGEIASYGPVSEDCLKLSVWTSNGFTTGSKRPVMFFIHGGSYASGGMCDPLYDGDRMVWANPDVILVSCDYRVNAFGFLDLTGLPGYDPEKHKDYDQSVNLGILDQQAGLKWVKENIANFGGDPENVTIFGESAGGGSVSCLLQAKGSEGLFQRAIVMSGALDLTDSPENYAVGNQARLLMKAAGKSNVDELLACSTDELLAALNTPLSDSRIASIRHRTPREGGDTVADLNNYPMCDDQRGIVPSDAFAAFKTNAVARNVDVMIGTTSEEMNYWAVLMHGMPEKGDPLGYYYHYLSNKLDSVRALYARFGKASVITDFLAGPGASHPFDSDERYNLGGRYPYIWGRTELLSELAFRMPAIVMAERHVVQVEEASGAGKTYMYYFCRPQKSIEMPWSGACHGSELTSVFKNLHLDVDGDAKKTLANNVSGAFVAFAKRGNPGVSWATYDTTDRRTTVIGTKGDFEDAELRLESDPDGFQRELLEPDYLKYREARLRAVDTPVPVALPTGVQGYSYVVSNLTAGAEIAVSASVSGGATYELPILAKVAIYAVPTAGYSISGTNPYVIEKVTMETAIDANDLPKALPPLGCEGNPWVVGEGVTAYTNGTGLVIGGAGTITNLAEVAKDGLTAIMIAEATVMGATANAFAGFSGFALTLPDGWQGELPDEEGNWYGAAGVNLMAYPKAVKNVTFQQRYPWNGKVDVGFDLTGPEGETSVVVTAYTNGTVKIATFTTAVTIPEGGELSTSIVWDAATAGLAADFKSDAVTVEVAFAGGGAESAGGVQLWANGPYWAMVNFGTSEVQDHPEYGALYKFDDATNAVTKLGAGWRLPSTNDFAKLIDENYCTKAWDSDKKGYRFTGNGDYSSNSIFLPAAGYDYGEGRMLVENLGYYWSVEACNDNNIWALFFIPEGADLNPNVRSYGSSVRAVQDIPPPAVPAISAKSAAGALDLTVGDRIAKDVETLVVDPAWGEATTATVKLQNGWVRTYTCASNDTWDTTALTPGRYSLAFHAGEGLTTVLYRADFWKLGEGWEVFDGANIEANMAFGAGKTYLILGTNTVADGATLTVADGAKFEYGAGAGFLGGTVGELPNRYEKKTVAGDLYQIVEKIKGSADNPWDVGEGVTAYTNGTELVIGGAGTVGALAGVDGLADLLADLTTINVASNGVTGAASDAFQGVGDGNISLTLPDGWQGELPDDEGNWYGAAGVNLTEVPLAVKNVTFQQRYPWNGLVDVGFGVTGPAGETNIVITAYTNGTVKIATFTAAVTIPESGVLATNLVWDAATAGLAADFKSDAVMVEVAFGSPSPGDPVQLWADGPYFATCNVGATKPEEYGYYFWWGDTVGYTNNGLSNAAAKWVSVVDGTTTIQFSGSDPTATNTYNKTNDMLKQEGWIDDSGNLVVSDSATANRDAARAHLGAPWRMMTKGELDKLVNADVCQWEWVTVYKGVAVNGLVVKGKAGSAYANNEVFLPAAGWGSVSRLLYAGSNSYSWSSTPYPERDLFEKAWNIVCFGTNVLEVRGNTRYNGVPVRAVRDTPPEAAPAASSPISAKSKAGTVDLRTAVTLAEGTVTVAGVAYSDTAWGAADAAAVTLGWTNGDGATGTLTNDLAGAGAVAVTLPKKNGDYRLTHSTGGLTSFVTFTVTGYPLGGRTNPWEIGAGDDAASMKAWKDGDTVIFDPARGTVTKAGLETVTNAMGGALFTAKLVSADGSETNDLVMVLGASGTAYDNLADALAANEASYTLFETKGYFVSYDGGEGALGTMATDMFIPTIQTNLTANAYEIIGYEFAGWTTNGCDEVAYTNCHEGVDFAAPGETLALKAKWTEIPGGVKPTDYDALTNLIAQATLPVTITLDEDIALQPGDKVAIPAGKSVTFAGEGKFDVTATIPTLWGEVTVGEGFADDSALALFKTHQDAKAYFEDGKVVLRGRGESEDFPWVLGEGVEAWVIDGAVLAKPVRGTASVAALASVTNALGAVPGTGELQVVSADGTATNDVVMLLGDNGVAYDTLADVFVADPLPATVRLFEVKGYWVSYSGGDGALGTMATDTFLPTAPTNLTANAYEIIGYTFAGWSTNGTTKAYDDRAAGVDFAEPGETLALTALWTQVETKAESFADLTNLIAQATLPVTLTLDEDIALQPGDKVVIPADKEVTFAGEGKFDVTGIVPQFGEPVIVGEGFAEGGLALFDAKGVSKPVFETAGGKVVLHARGESEDFPWIVGGDADQPEKVVTAWVDPALTNIAAVVIDNGLPMATNAIDLVALTNNLATYGYEPAKTPLNALLKVGKDGGAPEYVKPVEWITTEGEAYATIADAIAAGATAVKPYFETKETEIPQEIVETGTGDDDKTYTAVVENKPAEDVEEPVKAIRADGLVDIATSEKKNVKLEVTPTNVEDVAQSTVNNLTNVLLTALKDQEGHPMRIMETNLVDLSVYYNETKQTTLGQLIAIHIPWTINAEYTYGVSRMHDGVAQAIPEAQPPVDLTSGTECFVVDSARSEIILYVKNFSDYLIAGTMPLVPRIGASIKWKLCYATGSLFAQLKLAVTNGQASAVENLKFVFEDRADGSKLWGASSDRSQQAAVLTGWTGLPAGTWRYVNVDGDALTAVKGGTTGTFGVQSGIDTANGTVAVADRKIELYKKSAVIPPDKASEFLGWVVWEAYGEKHCAPVGEGEIVEAQVAGEQPTPRSVPVAASVASGSGTVKYPAANASTGLLKEKANAAWTATADAGSVFAGWIAAEGAPQGVVDRLAALSANELRNKKLTIKVGAGEQIRPTDVAATWVRIDADAIRAVGLTPAGLVVDCRSYVTATVSGLPTGLKFDKKTLAITGAAKKNETKTVKVTVKNASGYTWKQSFAVTVSGGAVTDVVAANDCVKTGTPVIVSGDAALGKVTGAKVYVAGKKASIKATPAAGSIFLGWYEDAAFTTPATNLPKGYLTASQSVVVPAEGLELYARFAKVENWAVGTFDGVFYDGDTNACGTVTFTVSSKGKVSGKVKADGTTYSFSAAAFDDVREIEGARFFVAHPTVKVGRETLTLELVIGESVVSSLGFAEISFGEEADAPFAMAVQNGWKLKPAPLPSFPTGKKALSFDTPEGLKVTFAAKGVAKVSGKVAGVSVSATTQVLPVAWQSTMTPNLLTRVCVYAPPKRGFDGLCAVYDVVFEVGEDNAFVRIIK